MFFKKRKSKIKNYEEEIIESHYQEVQNMYSDMRGWRHDFKNHLQILKALTDKGDLEAIGHYLNQLEESLIDIEPRLKTGNAMTDAILNSKISLAKSKNIRVVADCHVPVSLTTSNIDLSIIIGNLLDNAIEACLRIEEDQRFIRIYMDMKNTQLYISITNSAEAYKKPKLGQIFASSKGRNHGLGLTRIDELVAKYEGYINRNSEESAFTTEILLPQ